MDIDGYLIARDFISKIGNILILFSAFLAILTIVSCLINRLNKYSEWLTRYLLLIFSLCFLLILIFHLRIFQTIKITDISGKFLSVYVPPWIEGEKLFLWALITHVIITIKKFNSEILKKAFIIANSLFIILVALISNPFNPMLQGFHNELGTFVAATSGADQSQAAAAYQQMYGKIKYFYNSAYMWLHPPLIFFSYAVFGISFIACIFMIFKKGESEFDNVSYNYSKIGYLMLTSGILLGYPWAITAWKNEPWWWSPKINMSLMTWVFYSAYLHSRIYLNRKGMWNTTAILGISAFLFLIFTYLSSYVLPGIHSYG